MLITGNTGPGGGHFVPTDGPVTFTGSVCPADINGDRSVDGADLAMLLSAWAGAGGASDLDRDGAVNGADLALLLNAWGACG
jgi:hypothetical protein